MRATLNNLTIFKAIGSVNGHEKPSADAVAVELYIIDCQKQAIRVVHRRFGDSP